MKRLLSFMLLGFLSLSLIACGDNQNDNLEVYEYNNLDACEGFEDCHILLNNEEFREIYHASGIEYLPMTNIDLSQIKQIYSRYSFNYFNPNNTDISYEMKQSYLWLFNNMLGRVDGVTSLDATKNYIYALGKMNDFKIYDLYTSEKQYKRIGEQEHFIFKVGSHQFIYLIIHEYSIQEYYFDTLNSSVTIGNFDSPYYQYALDINDAENVTFTSTQFTYKETHYNNSNLIFTQALYMNHSGGYYIEIDQYGVVFSSRSFLETSNSYGILDRTYECVYDKNSDLFIVYDSWNNEHIYVDYDDFFITTLTHPNLDPNVDKWLKENYTKEFLIQNCS